MDIEISKNTPFSEGFSGRSKTALRMKYEAEVKWICRKYGSLEEIRHLLGLSQRKMCQLLLVDPSAWNRWTKKDGEGAPPHVYRALEWYLHLQEKNPALDQRYWLSQIAAQTPPSPDSPLIAELREQVTKLEERVEELSKARKRTRSLAKKEKRGWLKRGLSSLWKSS